MIESKKNNVNSIGHITDGRPSEAQSKVISDAPAFCYFSSARRNPKKLLATSEKNGHRWCLISAAGKLPQNSNATVTAASLFNRRWI